MKKTSAEYPLAGLTKTKEQAHHDLSTSIALIEKSLGEVKSRKELSAEEEQGSKLTEDLLKEKLVNRTSGVPDLTINPVLPGRTSQTLESAADELSNLINKTKSEPTVYPMENPLFAFNRSLVSPSDRYHVRTGVFSDKPLDRVLSDAIEGSQQLK